MTMRQAIASMLAHADNLDAIGETTAAQQLTDVAERLVQASTTVRSGNSEDANRLYHVASALNHQYEAGLAADPRLIAEYNSLSERVYGDSPKR